MLFPIVTVVFTIKTVVYTVHGHVAILTMLMSVLLLLTPVVVSVIFNTTPSMHARVACPLTFSFVATISFTVVAYVVREGTGSVIGVVP